MKTIKELFSNRIYEVKKTRVTERGELLDEFHYLINLEKKDKPFDKRFIAFKISHIPTRDLYYFLSQCKDYKNRKGSFSKMFFGALKVK